MSVALLALNPALSTLLAERAVDTRLTPVADEALRRALGADQMRRLLHVSGPAQQAIFSPDGSLFAAEVRDTVSVWRDGRWAAADRCASEGLDRGTGLLSGIRSRRRRVDRRRGEGVAAAERAAGGDDDEPGGAHVGRVAFNGQGSGLLTGSADGTVRLWNAATGSAAALISESPPLDGRPDPVLAMGISPNSSYVVSGTRSGAVTLARAVSGHIVTRRLKGQSGVIIAISFSADGSRFATASGDGTAAVRRADGSLVALIRGAPAGMPIFDGALSPDGKLLVITALGTSALWNVDSRQRLAVLAGPAGSVQTARLSPDHHFFVTGGSDGVARVWQATGNDLVAPGQLVTTLAGHGGPVNDAEFSPDGEQVLTAGSDATVRVWQAAPGRALLRYQGPVTAGSRPQPGRADAGGARTAQADPRLAPRGAGCACLRAGRASEPSRARPTESRSSNRQREAPSAPMVACSRTSRSARCWSRMSAPAARASP